MLCPCLKSTVSQRKTEPTTSHELHVLADCSPTGNRAVKNTKAVQHVTETPD